VVLLNTALWRARTMTERAGVNSKDREEPFPSSIAMDLSSFEMASLANNEYKCPACGEAKAYDKDDPFFRDTS
jgi:hypothetical protein